MSVLDSDPTTASHGLRLRWLGRALFLGMSWTWCIGMFLPVLLVRDFGVWGWIVFAVPNVIGAAAMGWVLSVQASRAIVEVHRPALFVFSAVTCAYQLFFAAWIFRRLGVSIELLAVVLAVAALAAGFAVRSPAPAALVSLFVFIASVFCWAGAGRSGLVFAGQSLLEDLAQLPSVSVLCLAPTFLFGFGLSPYLDITFHRARQQLTAAESRGAFSVGFGVFFLSMIVFSLCYAGLVAHRLSAPAAASGLILSWIGTHWLIQLAYSVGLHLAGDGNQGGWGRQRATPALSIVATALAGLLVVRWNPYPRLDPGEFVYWFFLATYGLIFPAYVWLCMIPGRGRNRPSGRSLWILAMALILATPMYWEGFIERRMMWLLPGVGLLLASRLFVRNRPPVRDAQSMNQQNSVPIS